MAEKAKTKMLVVSDPDNDLRRKVLAIARRYDKEYQDKRHTISDVIRKLINYAYDQLDDSEQQPNV
jgi:hypothetical protein